MKVTISFDLDDSVAEELLAQYTYDIRISRFVHNFRMVRTK